MTSSVGTCVVSYATVDGSVPLPSIPLRPLALVLLLAGCRCDDGLRSLEADIAVEPEALAFSRSVVGRSVQGRVQIGNRGSARLTLAARVEPDDIGFSVTAVPDTVAAGLADDATVAFQPLTRGAVAATLVLASNDPDTPELRVPLTGEGGPPILSIEPSPIDLGLVNEGAPRSVSVALANTGFDVLQITSAVLQDGGGFTLDQGALPVALAPGERSSVVIGLAVNAAVAALASGGVLADRLIVTHADGEGSAPVTAIVNRAPIAVAVEQVTRRDVIKVGVGRAVLVDGSETLDPEGDAFTFQWLLSQRPAASVASLVGQGQPGTRVTPDQVGRYVVTLLAVDARGAVGVADLEILPRDLAVVLTWGPGGGAACLAFSEEQCAALTAQERALSCCGQSDLDLHVVRPGGTLGDYGTCPLGCDDAFCNELDDSHADTCRQSGTDCAFNNRAPDWGALGRIDDPRLDVDDVRGFGPEITSVDEPEDGIWRVVVHYCGDRIGEPSAATVRIFEEGIEVFASGPEVLVESDAWSAVTMTRQSGAWESFVAGPGVVVTEPGLCD